MKRKITFQVVAFMATFQFMSAQSTITVDNTPGSNAQFSDLQIAIASAQSGDIIYIQPSEVSYGDILVDKPLTLTGFAHSGEKQTLIRDIRFGEAASNCKFSGLRITNQFRVQLNDESVTLTNMVIENCRIDGSMSFLQGGVDNMIIRGCVIWSLGGISSVNHYTNTLITDCIITNNIWVSNHQSTTIKNNLFLTGSMRPIGNDAGNSGTLTVQNNIIYISSSSTIDRNHMDVIYENSLIYNRGSGNALPLQGTGNLTNLDPLFVEDNDNIAFEATLDDYHLQTGSVAIGAGVDGEDIGLYGSGDFVFNNFGLPNGIPTVKIEAITNTVAPGENINLVISTNTH
ncbi:hypothetical protein [Pricia sp.]|uniref:hypothetical protein n=1 Tax=Pricia sp. TaxID=2268138 RepID=UPI003594940E